MNLINKSLLFATQAHSRQFRKYTHEPYIEHPIAVAQLVVYAGGCSNECVAAALLHDVVKDTPITIKEIGHEFGGKVAYLVAGLTNISKLSDGNRVIRKEIDNDHLAKGSSCIHTIKLADLIHNSESIIMHDREFVKVFIAEKKLLLKVLINGNKYLFRKAENIIFNYYK